jgi:hypothetical protein
MESSSYTPHHVRQQRLLLKRHEADEQRQHDGGEEWNLEVQQTCKYSEMRKTADTW